MFSTFKLSFWTFPSILLTWRRYTFLREHPEPLFQSNTSWTTVTPGLFCFCFQEHQSCTQTRVGTGIGTTKEVSKVREGFKKKPRFVVNITCVSNDAKVIYYTLLCHQILRDKTYDMTKRCDLKFCFDDVESSGSWCWKHNDSFWCWKTPFVMLKRRGLSGTSGLSAFLRKTAFKLILIYPKYSDTSLCPYWRD